MKKILLIVALAFAFGACDELGVGGPIPNIPLSDMQFNIEAVPAGDFTKATDTAFEVNDAVNVYGFKGDALSSITSWQTWLAGGKFTKTESGFTSDQTYYWYEGEEKGIIIGLYPYNETHTAEALLTTGVEFCVKSDQSTHAGYTASDLMTAYKPDVIPTSENVVLEFDHLLSKLVVDINNQTGVDIKEVYIDGVKGNINYSFGLGVSLQEGSGTIKAGELATASDGYTDTYVLIVPPQSVAPSIAVTTTDNRQYTYNATESIEFGMGKVRHLLVTITEQSISTEFDAIVNDWSADESVEFKDQPNSGDNGDDNGNGDDNNDDPEQPMDMQVNPNWSAYYVPDFTDNAGTSYDNIICIDYNDENSFFVEFLTPEYFNDNVAPNMRGYAEGKAKELVEFITNYNATNGTDYDISAINSFYTGPNKQHYLMNYGTWIVAMWGMTPAGEVTGLCYISEPIEIADPATPEYKAWLGTYKIISSNGEQDAVTSMITVTQNVVNESYWIEGWNGITDRVAAIFNPTGGEYGNGTIVLYPQTIWEDIYIEDLHLTKILFGGIILMDGGHIVLDTEDLWLAQAMWLFEGDNNWAGFLPYSYSISEGGAAAKVSQVGFYGVLDDGNIVCVTSEIHTFQEDSGITMIRKNPEEPAAVARKRNPLDMGNNGVARPLEEVKMERKPQASNYVVGGRKFNAINF